MDKTRVFPVLNPVRPQHEAPAAEHEVLAFWEEAGIFKRSIAERPEERRFVFFEGPPTANGRPGVHHAISRLMKDLFCRYWTMKGYHVTRKAGWDTHGLPVEIEVEKELGLEGKAAIEQYGIARFNQACRASVFKYEQEWRKFTARLGMWLDLDDRYVTCENPYIESVWAILKNFWDRELIYRGHKVVPYCPRCGTPLSSHEVSLGYEEVEDPSVFVRFRLTDHPGRSLLVWTTTPWTLPANVAVAAAPGETYSVVRQGEEELVVVEARREAALRGEHQVVGTLRGAELVGLRYEPLFDFLPADHAKVAAAHRVVAGDFVSLEEGTGLVHIAPAFGADDFRLAQEADLPVFSPIDARGRFTERVPPWAGKMVKEADPEIIADLKGRGLLYHATRATHSYPFCWRCGAYLIYFARETWYLRTTQFKDDMQRENAAIRWVPEEIGAGRFGRWLEGNVDWALSRDRYWGTPLNIWTCAGCGRGTSVGSIEELRRLAGGTLPDPVDLHRPYVDELTLACDGCGQRMRRTPEVLDVWFDSGAMPYAQWNYPVSGETSFREHFPADFIAEAVDQTRGWFYSLLAISTLYSGRSSYRACLVSELVLDDKGRKMSKSLGNTVPPDAIFDAQGADALRWYLAVVNPPWITTRFSVKGIEEQAQKMPATLRNVCTFFSTYARIDEPDSAAWHTPPRVSQPLDRWILSRLEGVVAGVVEDLDGYQLTRGARRIQNFVVEELSNWYVRRSRRRFWRGEEGEDKRDAYHTLFWVLSRVSRLLAPYTPFLAEELHRKLIQPLEDGAPDSVHLAAFPEPVESLRDAEIEADMERVLALVTLGRAARMEAAVKVRQPLPRLTALIPGSDAERARVAALAGIVEDELNVREVVVNPAPSAADASSAAVRVPEGVVAQSEGPVTVLLDTRLTPELRSEGLARELVNKIQFMRKKGGLKVTDRIHLAVSGSPAIADALRAHEEFIRRETLAETLSADAAEGEIRKDWDLNGEPAAIAIRPVTRGHGDAK